MEKLEEGFALKVFSRSISQESGSACSWEAERRSVDLLARKRTLCRLLSWTHSTMVKASGKDRDWGHNMTHPRVIYTNLLCRCGALGKEIRKQICES